MVDFYELHEIDAENVEMRLFVQTFAGEVRKWFIGFPAARIATLADLQGQFLNRWEVKKNPLQILAEYEQIKRNAGESVQDYCIRFNLVYNEIPNHLRPPMGLAMVKFPDGFDADMAYQLRERKSDAMEDMQKITVSVEANLLTKRARAKAEKKVTVKEESSSIDHLLRKVEQMLERVELDKLEPQVRNPNFRGQQQPQYRIRQRDQRAQEQTTQQPVQTPLQNFFVHGPESDEDGNIIGEENHLFTPNVLPIYLIEDEEYAESSAIHKDVDFILARDTVLEEESDEYQRGYINALSTQQERYSLRNIGVTVKPIQKRKDVEASKNDSSVA